MKKNILIAAMLLLLYGCAKDLALYPLLTTSRIPDGQADKIVLTTTVENYDSRRIDITSVGYTWAYNQPERGASVWAGFQKGTLNGNEFRIEKTDLPITAAGVFRAYAIVNAKDTVWGNPVQIAPLKTSLLVSATANDGTILLVSSLSGIEAQRVQQYGHLWIPSNQTISEKITLSTPGISATAYDSNLMEQFTDRPTLTPGQDYKASAYMVYGVDTIYGNTITIKASNTCSRLSDFPGKGLWGAVSFTIGDKAFIATGEKYNSPTIPRFSGVPTKEVWMFDPSTQEWTAMAPFPGKGRYGAVAFVIDDKAYVGSGSDHLLTYKDFYVYSPPPENKWDTIQSYPFNVSGAAAFSINGKGYVTTGGTDWTTQEFPTLTDLTYEYNPDADIWISKRAFPANSLGSPGRAFAIGMNIGNRGFIGTGLTPNHYINDFYEFLPGVTSTGSWQKKANIGSSANAPSRARAAAFELGGFGYVGLGSQYEVPAYNDLWQYNPATNKWVQKSNIGNQNREYPVAFSVAGHAYIGLGVVQSNQILNTKEIWGYFPE